MHREELDTSKEEADARFVFMDVQLGEYLTLYADAEVSGEYLQLQAEKARQHLRDLERAVSESEYAERALQTRIADLKRNLQLAADQAQRATSELEGLQGELFELDASATQAGLQDALELRAEREEALGRARI